MAKGLLVSLFFGCSALVIFAGIHAWPTWVTLNAPLVRIPKTPERAI